MMVQLSNREEIGEFGLLIHTWYVVLEGWDGHMLAQQDIRYVAWGGHLL